MVCAALTDIFDRMATATCLWGGGSLSGLLSRLLGGLLGRTLGRLLSRVDPVAVGLANTAMASGIVMAIAPGIAQLEI
jgi:hypothetical protein